MKNLFFLSLKIFVLIVFYSIFFLFSNQANAEKGDLRVAVFIGPPFVDVIDNKLVGEYIEIAKLLANSVQLNIIFIRCPFVRCLSMVQHGQADMIFGLKKLPEREKSLIFLNPPYMIQHNPLRFFTLSSSQISISRFEDLNKLTIGVLRGAKYYDLFDSNNKIAKVEVTSREQLVSMLLKGHIDTFISREESIIPLLPINEYKQKISLAYYQYKQSDNSYIAISKYSEISEMANVLSYYLALHLKNSAIR